MFHIIMRQSRVENEHSITIASMRWKRDISELPLRVGLKCVDSCYVYTALLSSALKVTGTCYEY